MSLGPEVRRGGNLPFGMFAAQWMCDCRYSTNARTLYGILITYADTQDRTTAKGRPYRSALARQLGVSLATLDRTLLELEVGGMVRIEPRKDPNNPLQNEANIYHLLDAPLMWQGNGTWADPLGPDVKAADVAKAVTEARRAEKRDAGVVRKGGVAKGISTKAVKAAREAADSEEGGSSTHAAIPGSTHAARVAAQVLPFIQSPVQTPSPDPEAPSGRSPVDGRSPSTSGSSAPGDEGGSAASGKTKPAPSKPAKSSKARHTRDELAIVDQVLAYLPPQIPASKVRIPTVADAILAAMREEARSVEEMGERINARWADHGFADKADAGTLKKLVGTVIALVRPLRRGDRYACADIRCEDGRNLDTDEPCRLCEVRAADWKAAQQRKRAAAGGDRDRRDSTPAMPSQRATEAPARPLMEDCSGPYCTQSIPAGKGPLCGDCLEQQEAEAASAALAAQWEADQAQAAEQATADAELAAEREQEAAERTALQEAEAAQRAAAEDEQRRKTAEEDARLRAEFARQHPELAAFSSQGPAPF
ncbi:hypothetical protein [Streptomyces cinereoruber]|uniref:hypothetical protein n=1 Tax=Streptomyces cinereoruber TaxID=67260 RepID=UPI00363A95CC